MTVVGVNLGALTVKVVALRDGRKLAKVVSHQGRPLEVLRELLGEAGFADADCFGVSGHLGHIAEAAAIQRALRELDGNFDAVASLGGESFLVYLLADGRVANVLSHNKCAAGSGEFFVQQIGRMRLGIDEAIRRSFDGKVIPLAARCSVHCKFLRQVEVHIQQVLEHAARRRKQPPDLAGRLAGLLKINNHQTL